MSINLWADRPSNNGGVIEPPVGREVSRRAAAYAAVLEAREEPLEALTKASEIIRRYGANLPDSDSVESLREMQGVRGLQRKLAKAAGQIRGGRSFAKLSGRTFGEPQGAGAYWKTQRDIENPNDEAEAGDTDTDEFIKALDEDTDGGCDQNGAHLNAIGYHLAKIKMAHEMGDHETCRKSTNAAMRHFKAFHGAMKDALAED